MMKQKMGCVVLSILFMLALVGCRGESPDSSGESNGEDYVNRYPGAHYGEIADYDKIEVLDDEGTDITHIAIDLWYAANEIYNVDDMKMFTIGDYETVLDGYTIQQSNELKNYSEVVGSVFTPNGIAQLEQTKIGGPDLLIRKEDDKVYRMGAWKTGYSFAAALYDMQVQEISGDAITLAVTYIDIDGGTAVADFTITEVNGTYLVDDYVYPEAYEA